MCHCTVQSIRDLIAVDYRVFDYRIGEVDSNVNRTRMNDYELLASSFLRTIYTNTWYKVLSFS